MNRLASIAAVLFAVVTMSGPTLTTATAQTPTQKPDQQAAPQKPDPAADQPVDFKAFNDAAKTPDPKKRIEAWQKFLADYPDSMLAGTARGEIRRQLTRSIRDDSKILLSEIDKSIEANPGTALTTCSSAADGLLRAGILLEEAEKFAEKGLAATGDAEKYLEQARAARNKAKPAEPKGTITGSAKMTSADGVGTVTWVPPDPSQAPSSPRTDDEEREWYRAGRAQLQVTLGQIYSKRGRDAEAQRLFKEVYGNTDIPSNRSPRSAVEGARAAAARELANFARKAGDDRALVQYLMESVVAGASQQVQKELRETYRKTHGSLDGLESMLDAMYEKAVRKIEVRPYERPNTLKEPRVVLAELFTGSECPPCVGTDLAFDAALERYTPGDLAFLVYHEHRPGPDPMTNPSTLLREDFYKVRGVPTFYIDGKTDGLGGGGADLAESFFTTRIKPDIELSMGVPPEASLSLTAAMTGSTIKVRAAVTRVTSKSDRLRLHIVLAEQRLRFQGGNGIRFHPMVVRSVASIPIKAAIAAKQPWAAAQAGAGASDDETAKAPAVQQGFAIPQGKGLRVDHTFDLTKIAAENRAYIDDFLTRPFRGGDTPTFLTRMDDIDPRQLVVVAFVQDDDPKQGNGEQVVNGKTAKQEVPLRHVLQAAAVRLAGGRPTN